MSRKFFVVIAIVQIVAGAAWAAWMVLSEAGLTRYVGLMPAVVLLVGAVSALLAARSATQMAALDTELQRLKTMSRLETKAEGLQERLEHFAMLKQWGIITEEECAAKRRALLGLDEPAFAGPTVDAAAQDPDGLVPSTPNDAQLKSRHPVPPSYVAPTTKRPRKRASRH